MKPATRLPLALAILSAVATNAVANGPADFMLRATIDGQRVEGQPLAWTDSQMLLLGRDGQLHDFHPKEAKDAKKIAKGFVAYSPAQLKGRLQQEFDRSYAVTTTQHFVVVHPRGEWSAWANRLESLYRSFTHYMSVRGFPIKRPKMPLVAVVFRNQADYYRYAAADGTPLAPGTLGHYSPQSNRVFLFDISGGSGDADWLANAETIIHEATHQTAYNTGVHQRFSEQPRWLVEGLAMMFEAPGVWGASSIKGIETRLNQGRLQDFRNSIAGSTSDWIMRTVASDNEFSRSPGASYAAAWTLSFYLCETRPEEYSRYLDRVSRREQFTTYGSKQRVADFAAEFGNDFTLLDAQVQRFVSELPR
ncbi:DUF1570 domain-containing protein [Adhaeretor mobilis]|uniref:DUF1570 domain-containing protein n=1 Tax=Adhaeretor mobilis TaxID=1930276 RepID=A0A517MQ23_9BACT|nr:DUF1570 domain-containing protein [Adhaeretor mobilis]QDS96985.1 hypothetical protein HG15A2_02440 [Adhaeretor mobilis]